MRCQAVGPANARIALIGEAPGEQEDRDGMPFVGSAGQELDRMLADAGIARADCWISNCVQTRPERNDIDLFINPKKTRREGEVRFRDKWVAPHAAADLEALYSALAELKPAVIVALGNTALWALTNCKSVDKWRGSILSCNAPGLDGITVIPTYHPAGVLRQYAWRQITINDLRRAAAVAADPSGYIIEEPERRFILNPDYDKVCHTLGFIRDIVLATPSRLICDLEIKRNEIVCLGLAWSRHDAICIPFYNERGRTFTAEQSAYIWDLLNAIFNHPNCKLSNQNISFDIQFLYEKAGLWPKAHFDTMVAQNVLFPGTPKSLDYLASMYCDWYRYWKDDGKFWDKPIVFPQLWHYNCLDCVYTYGVQEKQELALAQLNLESQNREQVRILNHAITIMFRGVRVNNARKQTLRRELLSLREGLVTEAELLASIKLTGDKGGFSPQKLSKFFYTRLGLKPIMKRTKLGMKVTCDDDAMQEIGKREPLLFPLTSRINLVRSYDTAIEAVEARVDRDGRWRCSYNIAGANTFRFSSATNPFGSGLNLQNLTAGKEITK
jgi:DNA polymerase